MILVPKWWSVRRYCLYEYACVPYWDVLVLREILTDSCINSETCWPTRPLSNTMRKTLSESGRVVHSLLGSGLCTGADRWGTFITGWAIHSGSDVRKVLELGAVSCLVSCVIFMTLSRLFLMLQICRGPWACVVCSVRCFCLLGKWRTTLGSWETEYLKFWIVSLTAGCWASTSLSYSVSPFASLPLNTLSPSLSFACLSV